MDKRVHRYALGRRFSLGHNKYFRIVYRRGKVTPGRALVLTYMRGRELRVGFSASAKVGGAVTRNRLRRWMREDFRMLRPDVKTGRYVFTARTAAASMSHPALKSEMRNLLVRAGLFAHTDEA